MISLSHDQKIALEALLDWYKSNDRYQFITLGGYAGTGKTTLISIFRKKLKRIDKKLKVAFVSYTGKATRVLDSMLHSEGAVFPKDSVSTIHSLIYSPVTNDKEEIIGWERKENIKCDLIIVDEASMVDREIWNDLRSYNIPIVAVGDHGQLPPIRGNFNLMEKPIIRLEEIHRQEKDNPIIKLSILARNEGRIPVGKFSPGVKKISRSNTEDSEEVEELLGSYNEDTLVLCGYNSTRVKLNSFIRQKKEIDSPTPISGDRVICLRNNHITGIYNGMIGTVKKINKEDKIWYKAEIQMDDGDLFDGLISVDQFNNEVGMNFTQKRRETVNGDLFDFGYALTVHKAQGGQAQRVILFEERFKQMDETMWRRWLYTGVTRAMEELYVIGN